MAQSHSLLVARSHISQWTLAIVTTITCNFAWQSHSSIVSTLDDLTNVASVTLMCPFWCTPHANVSIACVLCIALQHRHNHSLLQHKGTQQVCSHTHHSFGGTTTSTAQNVKAMRNNDNKHTGVPPTGFPSLVPPLCWASCFLSP